MKAGTGIHMTDAELRAWTRFNEAARRLEDVLARHLKGEHGMLHSEYEILVRLDGAGGKMRVGVLASQIVISHSRVSHTIDRLVDRDWLTREPSEGDQRGHDIVITEAGTAALASASKEHAALIKALLLEGLDEAELGRFADQMQSVIDRVVDHS